MIPLSVDLHIAETPEAVCQQAAEFIIATAVKAVEVGGRFSIALSGGNTPAALFRLLAEYPYVNKMPWQHTYVFWGDERYVPLNDEQSNARMARLNLLDKVAIPPGNVFPVPVNLRIDEAAAAYEKAVCRFFENTVPRFDIVLLGLGDDGHTASLFPNNKVLFEPHKLVSEVYLDDKKVNRITMTPRLLNQAYDTMFLVTGKAKAPMVKTILTGDYEPEKYPAQLIKPQSRNVLWFLDNEAASLL